MNDGIKAIIGLGNPGKQYYHNRHTIGFVVLDALAEKHGASWQQKKEMEVAEIMVDGEKILLIKPQTFMNSSGKIIPSLAKQGIKAENILVVHDELEKAFGKIEYRAGGSHRGHNGLRSIMEFCGPNFFRLRFGVGRPENKEDVPAYVLANFTEKKEDVENMVNQAVVMIDQLLHE